VPSPLRPAGRAGLKFYEDLSEQEIARTLGCRIGTVKSRLHRGLANLRKGIKMNDRQSIEDLLRRTYATVVDLPDSDVTVPSSPDDAVVDRVVVDRVVEAGPEDRHVRCPATAVLVTVAVLAAAIIAVGAVLIAPARRRSTKISGAAPAGQGPPGWHVGRLVAGERPGRKLELRSDYRPILVRWLGRQP